MIAYDGFRMAGGQPMVSRTVWLPVARRLDWDDETHEVAQGGNLKLARTVAHRADRFDWGEDAKAREREQLAIALIADAIGADVARAWYQDVARTLIVTLPDRWRLTGHDIGDIIDDLRQRAGAVDAGAAEAAR